MQGRGCMLAVSLIFCGGFVVASLVYLLRQSYIQAFGFLLLAAANTPELLRLLQSPRLPMGDEPDEPDPNDERINRIATATAIVGLAMLGIGWVTSAPPLPATP